MTSQDVDLQMMLNGVWTDVPLYSAAGATVQRGLTPYAEFPRATKIEVEINNDTLAYDPSRPESALYGIAGRNTRCRVLVNGVSRVHSEASAWRPTRSIEHTPGVRGRASVGLVAEGLLRRIGMWSDPLRSPMYRAYSARTTNIGHWPLEEESSALTLANSGAGLPGTFTGVDLGQSESPQGAERSAQVRTGSRMAGQFTPASTTAGWQLFFSVKADALPVGATYVPVMTWATSNGLRWEWAANDVAWRIQVTDTDGTVLESTALIYVGSPAAEWTFCRVRANQSGGNVALSMAWYFQDSAVITFDNTLVFAGTVGGLRSWRQDGNATTDGWLISHVGGVTTVAEDLFSFANLQIFNGYQDERAGWRFVRLMGELGLTGYTLGAANDTMMMGPQRADTVINLLKEIVASEDGRIDDERFDIALTMRTRLHMYNQTPVLTLTYPTDIDAGGFEKSIDDQGSKNRVTVKNRTGGEVTQQVTAGPMSLQPPPAGIGEYKATVEVNLSNDLALPDRASWELAKGTLEEPRYERVVVNLLAQPGLETACNAVREGDMIRVTGAEPAPVDLLVVGILQNIGAAEHRIEFLTEPYAPRVIGTYDGAGRRGAATTTLGAARDAVQTAWSFSSTSPGDRWEGAPYLPYNVKCGGEVVTVTAMGAQTGTGPYTQAATVVRSVNGVVKAQTAGTPIDVNTPVRRGL
jgi:hypothetical protein